MTWNEVTPAALTSADYGRNVALHGIDGKPFPIGPLKKVTRHEGKGVTAGTHRYTVETPGYQANVIPGEPFYIEAKETK